jgi:hypothetical protein
LLDSFPDRVWAIWYPALNQHYCVSPRAGDLAGVQCMVVLSTRELCKTFIASLGLQWRMGAAPQGLTFDGARKEAQRAGDIDALILVDDPGNTQVHYIR